MGSECRLPIAAQLVFATPTTGHPDIPIPRYLDTPIPRLVLLLSIAAFCACRDAPAPAASSSDANARDTTVVDDLGRTLTFRAPARRVLALAPSLTEVVYAVGGTLAAVSPVDDYPPAVADLPTFATFPLDHERVVSLRPDLVLATDQVNRPDDADALAGAGVSTYFFRLDGPADVPRVLRTAGTLLGRDGDTPARAFESRLAMVREAVDRANPPRVLMLVGDETPYAFGLAGPMLEAAGGTSVTADLDDTGAVLSEEWVLSQAPDVVVVLIDPYEPENLVRHHPSWRGLPAVRSGRVHGLDPDLASRPGPRMAEGVARLAALLHPDRFPADAPARP